MFNRKKSVFKKKIRDVEASIWEYEFKIHKARQMREDARQRRDRTIESLGLVQARVEAEKDESKLAELNKEKDALTNNVKAYEGQMKMIDAQINGAPQTEESDGQQGLLEIIAGLVSLKEMYKDYVKTL